jgi:hypothetical protein
MASLTASWNTNSMKQSPWAANSATDIKELAKTPKVHIHVHNSSNVHPVLIQDNAVPTVPKVYILFTLTRSSRPDLGLQTCSFVPYGASKECDDTQNSTVTNILQCRVQAVVRVNFQSQLQECTAPQQQHLSDVILTSKGLY